MLRPAALQEHKQGPSDGAEPIKHTAPSAQEIAGTGRCTKQGLSIWLVMLFSRIVRACKHTYAYKALQTNAICQTSAHDRDTLATVACAHHTMSKPYMMDNIRPRTLTNRGTTTAKLHTCALATMSAKINL